MKLSDVIFEDKIHFIESKLDKNSTATEVTLR